MRLSYAVLPPALVESFSRLKSAMEDRGPLLDQATLAGFLESGALDSHLHVTNEPVNRVRFPIPSLRSCSHAGSRVATFGSDQDSCTALGCNTALLQRGDAIALNLASCRVRITSGHSL